MEPFSDVSALAEMNGDLPISGTPAEAAPDDGDQLDLETELARRDEDSAALRQQLSQLEQRLRDTQRWAQDNNQARLAAEAAASAVTAALNRQDQGRRQEEAARAQVPRLTQAEKEAILADPDLLEEAINRKADFAAKWAVKEAIERMGPTLQEASAQARGLADLNTSQSELLARVAIGEARSMAERAGIQPEEFDRLLPHSYNRLMAAAQGNEMALMKMATTPRAIVAAINDVRLEHGVPVEKPAVPPSIGSGRRPGRAAKPELQVPPAAAEIWRKLGVTPTREMIEDYNKKMAAAGGGR